MYHENEINLHDNGNFEQPQLTGCQKSWRALCEDTEKELDFILSIQNVNSS